MARQAGEAIEVGQISTAIQAAPAQTGGQQWRSGEVQLNIRMKPKRRKKLADIATPTPEQMRSGSFELADILDKQSNGRTLAIGKAYRRRPMIETLHGQGLLSDAEYRALKHYRHHADCADRSPTKDSLASAVCPIRGGSGDGPSRTLLHAQQVRDDCERAAGSLVDILRAVVVEDLSLSDWAIRSAGGLDQCRERKGRRVCTVEPRKHALDIARLEIKIAAGRVQAELDA